VSAWLELFAVDAQTFRVGAVLVLAFCGIAGWMLAGTVEGSVPEHPAPTVRLVTSSTEAERNGGQRPQPKASVHELWCQRRAAESPIFAQLAREMGLGLALGVAA